MEGGGREGGEGRGGGKGKGGRRKWEGREEERGGREGIIYLLLPQAHAAVAAYEPIAGFCSKLCAG